MDLQEQAAKLNKEIEKITRVLTELSEAQRTAKENRHTILIGQLKALQEQLQSVKVIKIVHKH